MPKTLKMREIDNICRLLDKGRVDEAIRLLNERISTNGGDDRLFYMRGNAYFKEGNWKNALEDYMEAVALNGDSPASEAIKMAQNILDYYNKDIYCQ